mgnify:CR=1 FL=1
MCIRDRYSSVTLTRSSVTNGSITAESSYKKNSTATVTAIPSPGYAFSQWTGDATGSDNPLSLTMDSNKTVGATFIEDNADGDSDGFSNFQELVTFSTDPNDEGSYPTVDLTLNSVTNGSLNGTEQQKLNSNATVTATPATGYVFTEWTGDASGSDNPLSVSMTTDKSIGATFTKDTADTDGDGFSNYDELVIHETDPADANNYPTRTLTAEATSNGSITSTESHKLGAPTTVTATPELGYLFSTWTGDASGSDNPLTITMNGNKTIGATFTKDTTDTDGDLSLIHI